MHVVLVATVLVLLRTDEQQGLRRGKGTVGASSIWIFDLLVSVHVLDFGFDFVLGHVLVERDSKERFGWRALGATKTLS